MLQCYYYTVLHYIVSQCPEYSTDKVPQQPLLLVLIDGHATHCCAHCLTCGWHCSATVQRLST
jgi:hypothetical protein